MYVKKPEGDEALSPLPSSVFTEQNILSNLFAVQKNTMAAMHQIA